MKRSVIVAAVLVACAQCARQPPRPGGSRPGRLPDEDAELVSRVVEARLAAATPENSLAAAALARGNATNSTAVVALERAFAWLRRENPGLWLLVASAVVRTSKTDEVDAQQLRRGLSELGADFHIAIVTTAALPWMTGTAVNPLLRAGYLAKAGKRVTLMVPWLHPVDQDRVFPPGVRFSTPDEQIAYIRRWLRERGGVQAAFRLVFYPGRYDAERGSILPLGDITRYFAAHESDVRSSLHDRFDPIAAPARRHADTDVVAVSPPVDVPSPACASTPAQVCVLEEPEHLTWYHDGSYWRHRFQLVVGVVHTNYIYYAQTHLANEHGGRIVANALGAVNHFMCQAYCDKVIKLSDTLQPLPRAVTCNVHGVRADFLEIGRRARGGRYFRKGAYFLGKALWAKGHRLLLGASSGLRIAAAATAAMAAD